MNSNTRLRGDPRGVFSDNDLGSGGSGLGHEVGDRLIHDCGGQVGLSEGMLPDGDGADRNRATLSFH